MDLTQDSLMGGRVRFTQPAKGYRAAIDPVLLAAAVPAEPDHRVLDLGCGAGAVALCLMTRVADVAVDGVEWDREMAALALQNAERNDLADRFTVETVDLTHLPTGWRQESYDQVVFNPPFLPGDRADPSPITRKQLADVEGEADLRAWVARAHRCLRPRARLTLIHRADRLDQVIQALEGFGEIVVFPLWPKRRVDARRIIVTARKGVRAPARMAAGLFLHDGEGAFTKRADMVLRGAALDV